MHVFRLVACAAAISAFALLTSCASTPPQTQRPTATQSAGASSTPAKSPTTGTTSTTPSGLAANMAVPAASTIYFDFDNAAIKDQFAGVIRAEAEYLQKSTRRVELQGNADERGSREYNMALGQKRADAAKRALSALGVKAERIDTISYGEDKPKANGRDEASWAENRRVDFVNK